MQDPMNSPAHIQRLMVDSEAYSIYQRLQHLDFLFFVYDRNFEELNKLLLIAIEAADPSLVSIPILKEITRLIHNYVASAKMLVDNVRPVIRKWYADTLFISEYNLQIKTRFADNKISAFIEDLRNFILHYDLPFTGARIHVEVNQETGEQEETVTIFLSKSSLMQWDWKKGKKYLAEAPEEIDIEVLFREYHAQIIDFHVWMHTSLDELHKEELDWLKSMDDRVRDLLGQPRS